MKLRTCSILLSIIAWPLFLHTLQKRVGITYHCSHKNIFHARPYYSLTFTSLIYYLGPRPLSTFPSFSFLMPIAEEQLCLLNYT